MKKILIVGASGRISYFFILCQKLNLFPEINIFWASSSNFSTANSLLWNGNITKDSINSLISQAEDFDAVFIFSGQTPKKGINSELYKKLNVTLPDLVIKAANFYNVKQILLMSSASVYGNPTKKNKLTEDTFCNPISIYGKTKKHMENLALSSKTKTSITIARVGNVAGADQILSKAFDKSTQIVKIHKFKDSGKGPLRSYIGPIDLFKALISLVRDNREHREIINIAADPPIYCEDLVTSLKSLGLSNCDWRYEKAPEGAISEVILDITKLKNIVKTHKFVNSTPNNIVLQLKKVRELEDRDI